MAANFAGAYRDIDIQATITLRTGQQLTVDADDIYNYRRDISCSTGGLPLGEAVSATYTMGLTKTACPYTADELDNAEVRVRIGCRNSSAAAYTYDDAGVWYVTAASAPEAGATVTLDGSDALNLFFDNPYDDDEDIYPAHLNDILEIVGAIAGVPVITTGWLNCDAVITNAPRWPQNTTLRSVVGYIAACAGGFAQIDPAGYLIITTNGRGPSETVTSDRYISYTPTGGTKFEFNCLRVTMLPAADDTAPLEPVRFAIDSNIADTASNCIELNGNPLYNDAIAISVRDAFEGLSYSGATLNWLGSPEVSVGWQLNLTALDGSKHIFFVTNNQLTFDGGLSVMSSSVMPATRYTSGHYSSAGRLFNSDGTLPATRVENFGGNVINAMLGKFDRVIADTIETDEFFAQMGKVVHLQVDRFEAGSVDAEIIKARSIDAEQIKANAITAESGVIANSAIGTAQIADGSITEAKVVSLNADVIQTGTLSAERLLLVGDDGVIYKINAASSGLSMTELSKDQYKKYINGTVIVAKSITAAQIAAQTITANEILSGTITAKEINVSDLFASQATINALNAMDISGNTYLRLMVTDAVDDVRMGGTQLIPATKDYSDGWNLWNCETYRNASAAWPEHVRLRQNMSGLSEEWRSSARTPLIRLPDDWQGRELVLSAYLSAAAWANVDKGITWTLCLSDGSTTRGYIYSKYNVVVPGEAKWGADMQYDRQPAAGELVRAWTVYAMDAANFAKQADTTYALTDCTHMFVQFWLRKNGDVRTVAPKLEWGNKPTDWSYAPEDVDAKETNLQSQIDLIPGQITAKVSEVSKDVDALGNRVTSAETSLKLKANQATLTSTANNLQSQIDAVPGKIELAVNGIDEFRAGTTVEITKDKFHATATEFSVAIVEADGETNMLTIDETGAQMMSLTAPDVAPRYSGPATIYVNPSATSAQIAAGTHYRSIADAAAALSNRWVGKNVVVYVAAGTVEYGTVTLQGTNGSGSIYIIGDETSPAKLVGMVQILYCGCPVFLRYLNVDSASGGVGIDCAGSVTMAIIENCVITGKGVNVAGGRGVRVLRGAHADVHGCELYDHERSLYAQQTGVIQAYGCKGNCKAGVNGGLMHATGTMPDSDTTFAPAKWGGEVFASSVTVDQGSKPTATPAPTTVTVGASATDSYTTAWRQADNIIRQGYYNGMGEWAGCMWFPTSSFSGKTIKSASLTLTRTNGSGKGSAVTLKLHGITLASASGNPLTNAVSYGVIGTIDNGETKTFTLPLSAAQALANGSIKGFMLYAGDGGTWNGKNYSTNYCKIDSSGDAMPRLNVTF